MEENIEFKDREYQPEEDLEEQQETSFWDSPIRRQQREKSLWETRQRTLAETPDAPRFEPTSDHPRLAAQREELEDMQNIDLLKTFLNENLSVKTSVTAGKESKDLYDNCKLVRNKRSEKIIGLKYKGVQVVVRENQFSTNKKNQASIEKFKIVLKNAEREYKSSFSSAVDTATNTFDGTVDKQVKQDFIDQLERDIKTMQNDMKNFMFEKEQDLAEKISEINTLKESVRSEENKVKSLKKKEERLQDDIAKKNSDIAKLTRELGTQAISQGKELAEKERQQKAEVETYKAELKEKQEQILNYKSKISKFMTTSEIDDLRSKIKSLQNNEEILIEKLQSAKFTLKQVEDENLRLQTLDPDRTKKLEDDKERLESEKKTLENELALERQSRIEAQSLLSKQKQNLEKDTLAVFTNKELREMNGVFKSDILERQDLSEQGKLDLIQVQQKFWLEKYDREQDPARKSTFESLKSFYQNQMDRMLAEMNKPPQFEENKEKLRRIAQKNELGWARRLWNFLKRNKLTLGGILGGISVNIIFGTAQLLYMGRKAVEHAGNTVVDLAYSLKEIMLREQVQHDLKQDEQKNLKLQEQVQKTETELKQQIQIEQKDLAQEKKKLEEKESKMSEAQQKQEKDLLQKQVDEQKKIVDEQKKKVQKLERELQQQEEIKKQLTAMQNKMQEQDVKFTDLQHQATQQAQKQQRLQEKFDEAQSKDEKDTTRQQLRQVQESLQKTQQQIEAQERQNKNQERQLNNFESKISEAEKQIQQLLTQDKTQESKTSEAHKTQQPDGGDPGDPSSILPFAWQREIGKNIIKYLGIAVVFLLKYLGTFIFWVAGNLITVSILGFSFILYKVFRRQKK